jgi:hypothetical protein
VFLVLSVACFSVGFVLFAYSSQQASFSPRNMPIRAQLPHFLF